MSKVDIIRAWRNEEYRASLSPEEQAMVPEHPAGVLELDEAELAWIDGGVAADQITLPRGTGGCCGPQITNPLSSSEWLGC